MSPPAVCVPGGDGRRADDFYATPSWLTRAMLCRVGCCFGSVLDAGAGLGAVGVEVESWLNSNDRQPAVTAVELDGGRASVLPGSWEVVASDFFRWSEQARAAGRTFDLVATNPPFTVDGKPAWTRWVDACLPLVTPGGTLAVLGFVNLLGGLGRSAWWTVRRPSLVLVSPRRPLFRSDDRRSGAPRETAWFVWSWRGAERRSPTVLDWLDIEEGAK